MSGNILLSGGQIIFFEVVFIFKAIFIFEVVFIFEAYIYQIEDSFIHTNTKNIHS